MPRDDSDFPLAVGDIVVSRFNPPGSERRVWRIAAIDAGGMADLQFIDGSSGIRSPIRQLARATMQQVEADRHRPVYIARPVDLYRPRHNPYRQ